MKKISECRRSKIAILGMSMIFILGLINHDSIVSVVSGIAAIVAAVCSANAWEKKDVKTTEQ